jgi:hypothetical protein
MDIVNSIVQGDILKVIISRNAAAKYFNASKGFSHYYEKR